jgi:fermentation-respiration switch protein FrsA (DUF1100 family)
MTTNTMSTTVVPARFDDGRGTTLVGTVHRPAGDRGPLAGIVVTGTWTSIKEQMAQRYADALAARGFAAVAFDHGGFGESGGEPRDVEDPARKARDIHAAVGFLADQPEVDARRLGALGVCASAGYTVANAVGDRRVRALALVAPWLHDAAIVPGIYGGDDGIAARRQAAADARARFEATGEVDYVPAVSADDPDAAMPMPIDFYENPERGALAAWPNRFAVMAWEPWLTFDPIALAPRVTQPTLIVHSPDAAVPDGARRFLAALEAPSDVRWTDGDQFDFYDEPGHVALAADAAAAHFARYLMGAA